MTMHALKSRAVYPVWRGSVGLNNPLIQFRPMPKREAAKLWHDARRFERATRCKKNHQDGRIGRNGLSILQALLFDFINFATGELVPSYEAIARKANISIRSVGRGLAKLTACGILQRWRRCAWNNDKGLLVQETNAYAVKEAKAWPGFVPRSAAPAPEPGTWGEHGYIDKEGRRHPEHDPLASAVAALDVGARGLVQKALDLSDGLAGAIGRLSARRT